ncbi:MAG: NfeD family protein [Oscillospiraceae bacterium]|nr:NfeD family protein [Oscillospiraceae bacterium]
MGILSRYGPEIFWLSLTLVFLAAEAMTVQLVTIWFAVGSAAALITSAVGIKSTLIQIIVFTAVSTAALVFTRPFVKKYVKPKIVPTNADAIIGTEGIVTETVDSVRGKGAVNVRGIIWTAKTADGSVINKDELVTVEKIDGVKLIVGKQELGIRSQEKIS